MTYYNIIYNTMMSVPVQRGLGVKSTTNFSHANTHGTRSIDVESGFWSTTKRQVSSQNAEIGVLSNGFSVDSTPEINTSEIIVDFQWHFPTDFQWHFPT